MTLPPGGSASRRDVLFEIRERLARPRIPSLDGIRAVAVLLVILQHFGFYWANGALGVEIFFTLSGFLITWMLLRENLQTGNVSFAAFYKRRTLRIFPAFYVYWLLSLVIYAVRGHEIPWPSVVASALYVENYVSAFYLTESNHLSHTWSLAIEEQFYLLWPVLFSRFRQDLPRLSRILLVLIACVWVYRTILQVGFGVYQGYLYTAFETRMDQLAVGCLLAVTIARGAYDRFWRLVTASPLLVPVTLGAIFYSASFHGNMTYRYTVGYAVEPVLSAVLIVQLLYFADRLPGRLFNCGPVAYVGRISYSLYLWQGLTVFTAHRLTESLPVPIQVVATLGVTLVFAALSYHLVEQRLRAVALRRRASSSETLSRRHPGAVATAASSAGR